MARSRARVVREPPPTNLPGARCRSAGFLAILLGVSWGCTDRAVLDLHPLGTVPGDGGSEQAGGNGRGGEGSSLDGDAAVGSPAAGCGTLLDRVHTTYPTLAAPAVPSDEYHPVLLAARGDDTSLLAYREAGANRVRVLALDQRGEVTGGVLDVEGEEAHALIAHETGGALVYVRDDQAIASPQYCRTPQTPGQAVCGSLELLRFDDAGDITMNTTLTDPTPVDDRDAVFIWWFEHTAKLVWAENTYGVYFRSAAWPDLYTDDEPHPTDTLRFVDASGRRIDRGWSIGCTPSWAIRLAYNGFWAAACHGDILPTAHRVTVFDGGEPREYPLLEGVPARDRALGGIAPSTDGFWMTYLERAEGAVKLRLTRLTATGFEADRVVEVATDLEVVDTPAYVFQAFLAAAGDELLLGWLSGGRLVLARADRGTGEVLSGPVATDAPIDSFVEFVSYPSGDVGWANADEGGIVSVTRVSGCRE